MVEANNRVELKEALQRILSVTKIELDIKDGALDLGKVLYELSERRIIGKTEYKEMVKILKM